MGLTEYKVTKQQINVLCKQKSLTVILTKDPDQFLASKLPLA